MEELIKLGSQVDIVRMMVFMIEWTLQMTLESSPLGFCLVILRSLGGIYHTNTNSYRTIPITVRGNIFAEQKGVSKRGGKDVLKWLGSDILSLQQVMSPGGQLQRDEFDQTA
ncbi:hypothetical protein HRG_014384 [Hirsutella rhossiliensis]